MSENTTGWERCRGLDLSDDETGSMGEKSKDETTCHADVQQQETESFSTEEVLELRKTVADQNKIISKLQDELKLRSSDTETTEDAMNETKKRKRGDASDEMNLAMVADSFDKDKKIKELKNEIQFLRSELKKQTSASTSRVVDKTKSTEVKQTRTLPSNPPLPNITALFQELKNGVEKQITDMKVSIEKTVEAKMAKVLESNKSPTMSYASAATIAENGNQATKQGNDFRTLIADTKNEELICENDRQRREMNIIVHGVKERTKNSEDRMIELDQTYVKELFSILGLTINAKSITRLGKLDTDGKCRPLKLTMNSVEDKKSVMSRLSNLKSAEEQYKNISIKDDYTPSERELIRYKLKQAQEMNERMNTNSWKVRKTPKNGLRIVKIRASTEIQTTSNVLPDPTQVPKPII